MQTRMLKFTPISPNSSSIIKNPQTQFTNFPNNKENHQVLFHIANFPKIKIANNKPLHISSFTKNNAVANSVSKAKAVTNEKKLHVSVFEPILSAAKQVFSSTIKLVTPYRFVVKNDLILFEHDGKEIVGVVERVVYYRDELMEATILSEHGLLENFKISGYDIINQTLLNEDETEKMWRICTTVECKDGDWKKMVAELKDVLNAHDNVKRNFVILDSFNPEKRIVVNSFVTVSELKTPRFEHYISPSFKARKVLLEIDKIRIKHGGSKEENPIKLIRSK
ncbi:hypothetical protein MKW94_006582 [Papaver nudicaule]|uniref:Uncharacterized protein n=1 Tax=Papaver nudicaule TaxID=74823 RepID=A0AA41V8W1_PAPNU|nr:hypothetical protein [Papaver nudicaule]